MSTPILEAVLDTMVDHITAKVRENLSQLVKELINAQLTQHQEGITQSLANYEKANREEHLRLHEKLNKIEPAPSTAPSEDDLRQLIFDMAQERGDFRSELRQIIQEVLDEKSFTIRVN